LVFTIPTINAITDLGRLGGAAASHRFFCDDQNDYAPTRSLNDLLKSLLESN